MKIQLLIFSVAVALLAVPAIASPARRWSPSLFGLDNDRGDAVRVKRDYGSLPHAGGTTTGLTITTADALGTSTPTIHGYTTSAVSLVTSASSVSAYVPSSSSAKPSVVTVTTTVTATYSSSSASSSGYFITTAISSTPAVWNHTSVGTPPSVPTNTSSALALSTDAPSSLSTYDTCTEEPTLSSSSYYPLPTSTYSDYSYASSSSYSSYDGTSSVPYHTPASSFSSTAPRSTAPLSTAPSVVPSSSALSSARWTNTSSPVTVTTTTTITYAATTEYLTTIDIARETSSIYILTAPSVSIPVSAPFLNATASLSVSASAAASGKMTFHLVGDRLATLPTRKPFLPEDTRRD